MATSWKSIASLDHAAAFRALGVKVMSDKGTDVQRDKSWVRWTADSGGTFPGTQSPIGPLIKAVNENALATIDPAHPILDFLGVLAIRHQLVDAIKNGTRYRIDIAQSHYGAVLVRGGEPHAVRVPPFLRTGDIKLASGMIRLGLPLAMLEGTSPETTIILASPGYSLGGDPANHGTLATAFRSLSRASWAVPSPKVDEMVEPVLNRLRSLMHVLWVRDQLHNHINGRPQNLIVQNPFKERTVLFPENADGKTMDRNRKFLGIP